VVPFAVGLRLDHLHRALIMEISTIYPRHYIPPLLLITFPLFLRHVSSPDRCGAGQRLIGSSALGCLGFAQGCRHHRFNDPPFPSRFIR
jgi:hypothetical protein